MKIITTLALLALAFTPITPAQEDVKTSQELAANPLEHHVYFWLKPEHLNEKDRETFEKALQSLVEIPACEGSIWGVPSPTPLRPLINASWHYALSLHFDGITKHDEYQTHPNHKKFVEKFETWWIRAEIMDVSSKQEK